MDQLIAKLCSEISLNSECRYAELSQKEGSGSGAYGQKSTMTLYDRTSGFHRFERIYLDTTQELSAQEIAWKLMFPN